MSKSNRGFASMDPERVRAIAAMGGAAVKPENRSFSKNKTLAQEAGTKGGKAIPSEKRAFSRDPALASKAGRKGGHTARTKA